MLRSRIPWREFELDGSGALMTAILLEAQICLLRLAPRKFLPRPKHKPRSIKHGRKANNLSQGYSSS